MKINKKYLKITILYTTLAFLTACETGVKNKGMTKEHNAPSGIVDKGTSGYVSSQKSSGNIKVTRIFSNSATPGYYIQVGYFANHKPNSSFMKRLNNSNLNYTVLDKNGNYYALLGAYYSYNQAKRNLSTARSKISSRAFVVQILRP